MSDKPPPMPPPPMEGWNISSRLVLGGMVVILAVLALALTLTEHRYRVTIEPVTHPHVHRFPQPSLDGFDNPAAAASASPPVERPLSDAALAKAASHGAALLRGAPQ